MSNLFSKLFGTVKHSVDSRSASRRSLRLEALEDRQLLTTVGWDIAPDTVAEPLTAGDTVTFTATISEVTEGEAANGPIVLNFNDFDSAKLTAAELVADENGYTYTWSKDGDWAVNDTIDITFTVNADVTGSTVLGPFTGNWADVDGTVTIDPADTEETLYFEKLDAPTLTRYSEDGADPETTAGISWTNGVVLPGSQVAGYTLLVNGEETAFETNAGGCFCFLEDLDPGTTYTFTVVANAADDSAFVDSDSAALAITTNDAVWNLATWQNSYSRFGLSTTVENGDAYLNLDAFDGKGGVINLRTAILDNSDVDIVSSATRSLSTLVRNDVLPQLDATNSDISYTGNTNCYCRQDNLAFLGTAGNDVFTIYGSVMARDYTYGQGGISLNDNDITDHPSFVFNGVKNALVNSGTGVDAFQIIDLNTAWTFTGDNTNANTLDFSNARVLGANVTGAVVNLNSFANQHMVCGEVGTIRILGNFNDVVGSIGRDVIVGNTGVNTFTDNSGSINVVNFARTSGSTVRVAGNHQVIYGGNGVDTVAVDGDFASIVTLGGNDLVGVAGEHNVINTGAGDDDVAILGAYNTAVLGNGFNRAYVSDRMVNVNNTWVVESQSQYNRVIGGNDRDYIVGWDPTRTTLSTGNFNFFYGGNGNDFIHGGAGSDYIYGQDGMDILCGGNGADYIYGGTGSAFILGNSSATGPEANFRNRNLAGLATDDAALAACLFGTDADRDAATRVIFGTIGKDNDRDILSRAAFATNFMDSGNDIICAVDLYDVVMV